DINGSISGGSEQIQYHLNGNYHKETTVGPGNFAYYKIGIQSNIRHKTKNDRFKLQLSTGFIFQDNNLPGEPFISNIFHLTPNAPKLYNEDGSLNWESSTWTNPLSKLEVTYNSISYNLTSNLLLSYRLFKGLEFKTNL